jgi:hypothetical protein
MQVHQNKTYKKLSKWIIDSPELIAKLYCCFDINETS